MFADINDSRQLKELFDNWKTEYREEFLDFSTGARGVKMLYDSFFKEVMNPEYSPLRLDDFLSVMLKQKVKVLHVLSNEILQELLQRICCRLQIL